jgi:hypothetical protein
LVGGPIGGVGSTSGGSVGIGGGLVGGGGEPKSNAWTEPQNIKAATAKAPFSRPQ